MPEEPEPTPEEWAEIEAADAYLDAVGNKRDFAGDQLGATEWRKDVDAEPLDWSHFPSGNPSGATPPTTGGTLSISENAAYIRGIAENQSPGGATQLASSSLAEMAPPPFNTDTIGALQEAAQRQEELAHQAAAAAGAATSDAEAMNGAGANAVQVINTAVQAAMNAQAAHEAYGQALQAAQGAADDATAACEQFRQTCSDVASRHGA